MSGFVFGFIFGILISYLAVSREMGELRRLMKGKASTS